MSEKMVTIRDVAKRLNLSITTISRALDGYPDVAEPTRRLVIETASEMGYAPNPTARQLRRQRSEAIGFILPRAVNGFSDPFFAEFLSGLGDEAASRRIDLLVASAPAESAEEHQIYRQWALKRKVAGVLLNRIRLQDWRVSYLTQVGLPFVTFNRAQDTLDYPSVGIANRDCFKSVTEHLVGLGHQRIAYVGGPASLRIQADRFAGYQMALQEAGLGLDRSLVVESDLSPEGGYRAGTALLSALHPPTAIACIDDLTAMGALHAAHELGFQVGSDVAVSGFDGISPSAHTQPPLTTVQQPLYEIARQMVAILAASLKGESMSERRVQLQAHLLVRASTAGSINGI